MKINIHQTHHNIADFDNIFKYLEDIIQSSQEGIHLFPELFLTGYPLQDLCLQRSFISAYQEFLQKISKLSSKIKSDSVFLMGGLDYEISENGLPLTIKNCVFELSKSGIKNIYTKQLLPNYDIFDEQKYFTPGSSPLIWEYQNLKIGILICEDMWASTFHHKDPVADLHEYTKTENITLNAVINLSASPFVLNKSEKRIQRGQYISRLFQSPFIYVNRVGGEDEILFDGHSFISDGVKPILELKRFQSDQKEVSLPIEATDFSGDIDQSKERTWESLFSARLETNQKIPVIAKWSDNECEEVLESLKFGVQEYATKCGFNNFTIALSGGMDSALVLAILRLSLKEGQYLEAIYMPSIYSSPMSYELSLGLCKNLGIPLTSLPIKFLHSASKNLFTQTFSQEFKGLTDENIQSRLRGTLLYTRSNQINSMVVNTSNKSELSVGYSTQYGDSVGAISMLGDLYKSEVYQLAEYINRKFNNIIPEEIITREPTAELREGQVDSQSLPPYDRLDAILEGILSYRFNKTDLIKAGFNSEEVTRVLDLYRKTEYKRYQFCPIIKISSKSFGFGYRIPISKSSMFYHN